MKKLLIITAGVFYFSSLTTNVNAQTAAPASTSSEITEPLTVKYLGVQDDYLVFKVEIKTGPVHLSVLKVEDAIEGELYSNDIYSNTKFTIMKIERRENQVLDFKLVSRNKVYTKTFTTDSNTRLYQKGLAVL